MSNCRSDRLNTSSFVMAIRGSPSPAMQRRDKKKQKLQYFICLDIIRSEIDIDYSLNYKSTNAEKRLIILVFHITAYPSTKKQAIMKKFVSIFNNNIIYNNIK